MDIPQWVKELVFAVVFVWFVDWEIRKVKKWVEELVHSKRPTEGDPLLVGLCNACGKPKSEDYADCPTCHRRFLDPGICGTEWNKSTRKETASP